jgi:guanine deaminase
MLPVLDEAYKVGMLNYTQILFDHPEDPEKLAEAQRNRLSPYKALYASTLGGAQSMRIDHLVGNFEPRKDADFVVLDWNGGQRALRWRQSLKIDGSSPSDIHEAADLLFGLIAAGDDRAIEATYVMANSAWQR